MTATITTDKVGHELRVLVDGECVKSFDEISDDYAHTNRAQYLAALAKALTISQTLREAQDKAWMLM